MIQPVPVRSCVDKQRYRTALTLRIMCLSWTFKGYSTASLQRQFYFQNSAADLSMRYMPEWQQMAATKIYVAQYHYILMTGRQKLFTGPHKCRPFTMLKNTLLTVPTCEVSESVVPPRVPHICWKWTRISANVSMITAMNTFYKHIPLHTTTQSPHFDPHQIILRVNHLPSEHRHHHHRRHLCIGYFSV